LMTMMRRFEPAQQQTIIQKQIAFCERKRAREVWIDGRWHCATIVLVLPIHTTTSDQAKHLCALQTVESIAWYKTF
jgi:hypothetical protein